MTNKAVRPMNLRHTAAAIARNYGDKGAVVITYNAEQGDTREREEGESESEVSTGIAQNTRPTREPRLTSTLYPPLASRAES